jgi:hypothetical protein
MVFFHWPTGGEPLRPCNPPSPPPSTSPYTLAMDAMDRMLASMSPEDTAATTPTEGS